MPLKEQPSGHDLQFYQCSNPSCTLRFPAPTSFEKARAQCPRCKSTVKVVPTREEVQQFSSHQSENFPLPHLEVLLDNIRSTFNVGAMLRTSDGAGVDQAHLCGITPQPDNPKITKVSLGAEYSVPWTYHPNAVQVVHESKARGLEICAIEILPEALSVYDPQAYLEQPSLLIVGNEVSGIDPGILDLCDRSFYIPMHGYKRSLNVAVAFGIALYALRFGKRGDPERYFQENGHGTP